MIHSFPLKLTTLKDTKASRQRNSVYTSAILLHHCNSTYPHFTHEREAQGGPGFGPPGHTGNTGRAGHGVHTVDSPLPQAVTWVTPKTILSSLPSAGWARPFDPQATRPKDFFVDEHRTVLVPMMRQKARHRFLHDPELQCTVLQMDHAGDATTFFVFPRRGALGPLEDALLPETLIKWDSLLRTR